MDKLAVPLPDQPPPEDPPRTGMERVAAYRAFRAGKGRYADAEVLLVVLAVGVSIATPFTQAFFDRSFGLHAQCLGTAVATAGALLPVAAAPAILRRRLARAGYATPEGLEDLIRAKFGPLVLLWRIPRRGGPGDPGIDPARRPWAFLKAMERHQRRARFHPAGWAARRRRVAAMRWSYLIAAFCGLAVQFLALSAVADFHPPRRTLPDPHWIAAGGPELRDGDAQAAYAKAAGQLQHYPTSQLALRVAVQASARLGDTEARDTHREVLRAVLRAQHRLDRAEDLEAILAEARAVLSSDATNIEALALAIDATWRLGHEQACHGYIRQLHAALRLRDQAAPGAP